MAPRTLLVTLIVLSNLAIVAGAAAFGWSPSTVVALFAFDALLGAARASVERLFAGKPRDDALTPTYPITWTTGMLQVVIYEGLLEKRGSMRIAGWIPEIYPRNLPYALHWWVFVTAFGFLIGVSWFALGPLTGGLDASLGLALIPIAARHVLIVAAWQATGRYERASASTVRRPRELLFSSVVVFIAVVFVGPQPADAARVVAAATFPLVLKLPFDFREAGIGPGVLMFDPSSDTVEQSVSVPAGEPRHAFENDGRTVHSAAGFWGVVHTVLVPGIVVVALIGFAALVYESVLIGLGGVVVAAAVALSGDRLAMWLAHGNVEYRVYDEALVAYDRYLDEPQWVVPFEDSTTITTTPKPLELRILLSVDASVVIERVTGEDVRLDYLAQPDEFVRTVRGTMVGRSVAT